MAPHSPAGLQVDGNTDPAPSTSRSFVRWAVLGTINTAISIVGLWLMVDVLGVPYGPSAVLLHLTLISNLYVWTSRLVFTDHRPSVSSFLHFHLTYLAQLLIQLAGLWLLIGRLGVATIPAQTAVITVAALFSFTMQRYVVFGPASRSPSMSSTTLGRMASNE